MSWHESALNVSRSQQVYIHAGMRIVNLWTETNAVPKGRYGMSSYQRQSICCLPLVAVAIEPDQWRLGSSPGELLYVSQTPPPPPELLLKACFGRHLCRFAGHKWSRRYNLLFHYHPSHSIMACKDPEPTSFFWIIIWKRLVWRRASLFSGDAHQILIWTPKLVKSTEKPDTLNSYSNGSFVIFHLKPQFVWRGYMSVITYGDHFDQNFRGQHWRISVCVWGGGGIRDKCKNASPMAPAIAENFTIRICKKKT